MTGSGCSRRGAPCPDAWGEGRRAGVGTLTALSAPPTAGVLHRPEQRGEIIFNPGPVLTLSRSGGQSVKNSGK